jgi:hypothetical protein
MENFMNNVRVLILMFAIVIISGCAGKRGDVMFALDTSAALSPISSNIPVVAGAEIVRSAYKSNSTTEFIIDSSFKTGGVSLMISGLPVLGSSVLASQSAYNAYQKGDIREFQWGLVVQAVGFATGQVVTGLCISMLIDITQAILNDKRKIREFEIKQKEDIFNRRMYNQEHNYIASLKRERTEFLAKNGLYSITYIIDFSNQ